MGHGFEIRKKKFLAKLASEGSLLVKDVAEELGISETTIRRDLNELDAAGLLKQVYGGAIRIEKSDGHSSRFSFPITNRLNREIPAKKLIGRCAASFVKDNDVVYIDPGTTSWEMIPYLKDKINLTIISNSVRLLQCLEYIGHHTIIQLGGNLRPDRMDTVGALAEMSLGQLRGYKVFQGGDGIDVEFGLSAVDHESALLAKHVIANAREIIVVADHTKFDQPSLLYKIIDIDKINYLITDCPLSKKWAETCASANVTVVVAASEE